METLYKLLNSKLLYSTEILWKYIIVIYIGSEISNQQLAVLYEYQPIDYA